MGLEMSVIRTDKDVNLRYLYDIVDSVINSFDWYLGDDNASRLEVYLKKAMKLRGLTRMDVLLAEDRDDVRRDLQHIPETEFELLLAYVKDAIGNHCDGNTHLNIDYELLPGKTVFWSCDWFLRDYLFDNMVDVSDRGNMVELNRKLVANLAKEWRYSGIRLFCMRWISYIVPASYERMVYDFCCTHGIRDDFVDINDLMTLNQRIKTVAKYAKSSKNRLWLETSF